LNSYKPLPFIFTEIRTNVLILGQNSKEKEKENKTGEKKKTNIFLRKQINI
jgi:hypothetical protein